MSVLTKEQVAVLRHDWEIIDSEGVQVDPDGVNICISHELLHAALAESQREVERLTREAAEAEMDRQGSRDMADRFLQRADAAERRVEKLREHIRAEVIEVTIHGGTICCQCEVIADAGEVLRHAETCILAATPEPEGER